MTKEDTYHHKNLKEELIEAGITLVAKEGSVKEPGSNVFLQKYRLGAYSTVRGAIQTMIEKELLYQKEDGGYVVYDKFFGHWLKRV